MIFHIMKFLDWPSKVKLGGTSKFFQAYFEDRSIWHRVKWEYKVMPEKLINVMKLNSTAIEEIRCNSLKEEDFFSCHFTQLLWNLPNLLHVNLFNCMVLCEVYWLENSVKITTLILSGCNNMSSASFVNGVQYLVNLRYLEIMFCSHRVQAIEVVTAVKNCTKLEVLNCFQTGNMRPWMVVRAMRSCRNIYMFIFTTLHRNDDNQERVQWYKILRRRYKDVQFGRQLNQQVEEYENSDPQVQLVKWIDYLNDRGI